MDNTNNDEITLTALQRAKKRYYEKIKNNPDYISKRNSPEIKAKIKESCHKYYHKKKNDPEFKKKVSEQKKEYYNKNKHLNCLLEIKLLN